MSCLTKNVILITNLFRTQVQCTLYSIYYIVTPILFTLSKRYLQSIFESMLLFHVKYATMKIAQVFLTANEIHFICGGKCC